MRPVVSVSYGCPNCGDDVSVRRRRADGQPFLGCDGYPSCRWTAPFSEAHQALADRIAFLESRLASLERDPPPLIGGVTLSDIRSLVSWGHPDRWPNGHVPAHDLGVRLIALLNKSREGG